MRLFEVPHCAVPLRRALELEAERRGLVVRDTPTGGYLLAYPDGHVKTTPTKDAA